MADQALSDFKVLDLTWHVAGPYCTKLLADYGADVIKIERPGDGDPTRRMGPFLNDEPHPEKSGFFLYLNTNKKSITLNLQSDAGKQIFKELVKDADVVVENFSPRVMPSLGLDYETLEKINPKLVMTSISNFGQTGPYRDFKAQEIVTIAMTGMMHAMGEPAREPLKYPGYQAQYNAALNAASGTLGALFGARRMGIGQQVDVCILEGLIYVSQPSLRWPKLTGEIPGRVGTSSVRFFRGTFPCKDGYVMPFCTIPREWPRLCETVERPDLLENPGYRTAGDRLAHRDEFEAIFLDWVLDRTKHEAFLAGAEKGVCIGPVYTAADLVNDPHFRSREFFVDIDHPATGTVTYPGAPFKMSETPWQVRHPAPLLGQHNEEIYAQRLGYSKEDLVRLRERGII